MVIKVPAQVMPFPKKIQLILAHRERHGSGPKGAKEFTEDLPGEFSFRDRGPGAEKLMERLSGAEIKFSVEE